ncbi:PTS sugar transporter subunit IIA [Candidatus Enterococcus mansonii]|uniref:PTS EIIA type-1 domain-containing protein n=1 Tax=Candidatus Enterococcus mansonii TaxID=1834181 RepID=A0A242CCD8_9ENTE|nr:PTS glucose transporter subunit IIA [Enterococcus sp. 4G2_DIV0659]OTO07924.1 hypothetical protein A5880_002194 [Enterococcus sp. 4G2_DIV0659]
MNFFKKKRVLKAVTSGQLISLADVNDAVFSANMMGEGYAIADHSGQIFSPVTGQVVSIFPTLHAITLKSKTGDTVLIHMGLDTVELKGTPFSIHVTEGQHVTTHTLLAQMNLPLLAEEGKDEIVIVVLPEVAEGQLLKGNSQVVLEEDVFQF